MEGILSKQDKPLIESPLSDEEILFYFNKKAILIDFNLALCISNLSKAHKLGAIKKHTEQILSGVIYGSPPTGGGIELANYFVPAQISMAENTKYSGVSEFRFLYAISQLFELCLFNYFCINEATADRLPSTARYWDRIAIALQNLVRSVDALGSPAANNTE